ncbi:Uncharacterised protein [Vibrio cholerae]|nr:Uncharacterised protein [Vibrio cholerae]CSI54568.1 Uncharacterised protein [Vibrio cholerae]CSI77241.1 Uncharacterised protein [Vibrio cholerae]
MPLKVHFSYRFGHKTDMQQGLTKRTVRVIGLMLVCQKRPFRLKHKHVNARCLLTTMFNTIARS